MKVPSASRPPTPFRWGAVIGLGALLGLAGACPPTITRAETPEVSPDVSKVIATYSVHFDGVRIGDFKFWLNVAERQYTLTGKAHISFKSPTTFDWKGSTSSSGLITAKGLLPANYNFAYETSDKREQIQLRFADNAVQEVLRNPPMAAVAGRVPITMEHLRDVVDPLSAGVLLSRMSEKMSGPEACERRLPIFDGKTRYDLVFNHKATRQLNNNGGYSGPVYVCKVKFVLIAGHKPDRKEDFTSNSDNIEVWLVPVPKAHLVVPYHVSIPTPVGSATITSERFEIETPATTQNRPFALESQEQARRQSSTDPAVSSTHPHMEPQSTNSLPATNGPAMGRRIALVIGNSAYENAQRLANPENDAHDIASALGRLGFEVTLQQNLGAAAMRAVLRDFEDKSAGSDWALVYFAGHGMQLDGKTWLIPTDARLERATDAADEAVVLDRVLDRVQPAKGLRMVMLDACRNNPFLARMVVAKNAQRADATRGLARIEPQHGELVIYAARDGQTAKDGDGRNSPFAQALLGHMEEPGLELGRFVRKVTSDVLKATGSQQEPFVYGRLPDRDFFFKSASQ